MCKKCQCMIYTDRFSCLRIWYDSREDVFLVWICCIVISAYYICHLICVMIHKAIRLSSCFALPHRQTVCADDNMLLRIELRSGLISRYDSICLSENKQPLAGQRLYPSSQAPDSHDKVITKDILDRLNCILNYVSFAPDHPENRRLTLIPATSRT